jgi:hypothetical protein
MTEIFTSLRDLHTNYILPAHFAKMVAYLPFRVEACYENDERIYIVSSVMNGLAHSSFVPGVEIKYWNGMLIDRAVEIAASYHAGSNAAARHARGVAGLTTRAMSVAPPPDEEWVIVGYKDINGEDREFRADWTISTLPEEDAGTLPEMSVEAAASVGLDLEGDTFRRVNKMLFAQHVIAAQRRIETVRTDAIITAAAGGDAEPEKSAASAAATMVQGTESTMPNVFTARVAEVDGRKFAYIRIYTFNVPDDRPLIDEFLRLIELPEMPKDGLIIDVRGNGGGLIWAGERLLQLLTPKPVEPCRVQFINTAENLRLCRSVSAFSPWVRSLERALESGATFSAAFPITQPNRCNDIGQRYYGPVVLITDARCYSTTDIFAAGFQDHGIGEILGVDDNTGAGGANVWTADLIRRFYQAGNIEAPLRPLPKGTGMRVAIRRTLRVGAEAGTELEDFGVVPDDRHKLTRADVLDRNPDLIAHAARMLTGRPARRFDVTTRRNGQDIQIDVTTSNVDFVDAFINDRPHSSSSTNADLARFQIAAGQPVSIDLRGYAAGEFVCHRRISV